MLANHNVTVINNKTLTLLRWIAILGQLSAVLISYFLIGINIEITKAILCILISIALNIHAYYKHGNHYLNEKTAFLYIIFDIIQISILLYFTGGIENPFIIFIIAPVVVAASTLNIRYLSFIILIAITSAITLSIYSTPLNLKQFGFYKESMFSLLFVTGYIIAICMIIAYSALYIWIISSDNRKNQKALRETQKAFLEQKRIAALGYLAASAAHELGSPLSTISIIAKDLKDELTNSCDRPCPMADDVNLLIEQSERCKNILMNLTLSPDKENILEPLKPDLLVELIANPFLSDNPHINVDIEGYSDINSKPFLLHKTPELTHSLGVLIQNAIEFAKKHVHIKTYYDNNMFSIEITDDGVGFSQKILSKIGQPYISTRSNNGHNMGLGIFIAKNIIESIKGHVEFLNKDNNNGAFVKIIWNRKDIEKHTSLSNLEGKK